MFNQPIQFHIEERSVDAGVLYLAGWCFSVASLEQTQLQLRAGKTIVASFACSKARPDVRAAFPDVFGATDAAPLCGFDQWIELPAKVTRLKLIEVLSGRTLIQIKLPRRSETNNDWVVGNALPTADTGALAIGRALYRKARTALRIDNALSPKQWKLWYHQARQEFHYQRYIAQTTQIRSSPLSISTAFTEKNRITPRLRALLTQAAAKFSYQPLISIVMPVYNVDPIVLVEAIASVQDQIYPHWELCIADDASTQAQTQTALQLYEQHPNIHIVWRQENGHICQATNSAAERASGEFVVFLDNDDQLAPHALFEIVRLLQHQPDADVIYSDEDKLDAEGNHYDLHFKPDWSPVLLLGFNYINHLTCVRRSLFEQVGRLRPGYEGAQDYDLLLRVTEHSPRVAHLPKILYHWRAIAGSTALNAGEKTIVATSAERILKEALQRRGHDAKPYTPEFAQRFGLPIWQLDWPDQGPSVEIIIPTFNQLELLRACIQSIQKRTTYRNYSIRIIDNDSDCAETLSWLGSIQNAPSIRVQHIANQDGEFSFSRINNLAVASSTADLILFLNNDTEVIEPHWLSRLVGYLGMPGVGVTGARLLYPNETVQHAGVTLGIDRGCAPGHAFAHLPATAPGDFFMAQTAHECAAVTGACLLVRRADFIRVGGFDEAEFAVSLNDIDLCLKLADQGLRTVYVAGAELIHRASATRNREDPPAELAAFRARYSARQDPYYNPNLCCEQSYAIRSDCTLDYADYLSRPLKVFFFTHNLNHEGAPGILGAVVQGLHRQGRIRPTVVSFSDGPWRATLEQQGIAVQIVSMRGNKSILDTWLSHKELDETVAQLKTFLRQQQPDMVVTNVLNTFFVVEAAHQAGIPVLWWIHESYDQRLIAKHLPFPALPRCEAALAQADHVLFVSKDTKRLYEHYTPHCSVIYNSLDDARVQTPITADRQQAARAALGIAPDQTVILTIGTVCERKDQYTLVEAARLLSRQHEDFVCYLVGYRDSIAYGNSLQRQIQSLGLDHCVKLIPEIQQVDDYYLAADIFVCTSLNESYSLAILEAMAFALPIVTTPCFGVTEQVRFGMNALRFDFQCSQTLATHLAHLIDYTEQRQTMGQHSKDILRAMQSHAEMINRHAHLIFTTYLQS